MPGSVASHQSGRARPASQARRAGSVTSSGSSGLVRNGVVCFPHQRVRERTAGECKCQLGRGEWLKDDEGNMLPREVACNCKKVLQNVYSKEVYLALNTRGGAVWERLKIEKEKKERGEGVEGLEEKTAAMVETYGGRLTQSKLTEQQEKEEQQAETKQTDEAKDEEKEEQQAETKQTDEAKDEVKEEQQGETKETGEATDEVKAEQQGDKPQSDEAKEGAEVTQASAPEPAAEEAASASQGLAAETAGQEAIVVASGPVDVAAQVVPEEKVLVVPEEKVPVLKWLISFDPKSFEAFIHKHPQVADPTDARIRKFAESFVERADLEKMSVREFMDALQKVLGEQRKQRKQRNVRILQSCVQKRTQREQQALLPKNTSTRGTEGQKEKKMITPKSDAKKKPPKDDDDDPSFYYIGNESDVVWATSVLAPLGFKQDGDLLIKPPSSVALPVLRGLKTLDFFPSLKNLLKSSQVGKVVNCLRRHSDPEVVRTSRDLLDGWKAVMAKRPSEALALVDAKVAKKSKAE